MALCTICLCSRRTMGAQQHPAETFSSCSPTSSRGLGCARGVTARPGGETAPTATEMVDSERHQRVFTEGIAARGVRKEWVGENGVLCQSRATTQSRAVSCNCSAAIIHRESGTEIEK